MGYIKSSLRVGKLQGSSNGAASVVTVTVTPTDKVIALIGASIWATANGIPQATLVGIIDGSDTTIEPFTTNYLAYLLPNGDLVMKHNIGGIVACTYEFLYLY